MTTPETLSPREIAARKLRERLRISVGPNARAAAEAGLPVALSGTEADEAVAIVSAALREARLAEVNPDILATAAHRLSHGQPEKVIAEMATEIDHLRDDLNVTRGMLTAARTHAGENPADLVGKVAKTLGRDWSALPDWELRAAARFTLAAIQADGKVVVDRADLAAYLNRGTGDLHTEVDALNRLLTAAGLDTDQQNGDDHG